jgi:hypothetical protein
MVYLIHGMTRGSAQRQKEKELSREPGDTNVEGAVDKTQGKRVRSDLRRKRVSGEADAEETK